LTQRKTLVDLESKLQALLEVLKVNMGMGYELTVKWVPKPDSDRRGEVKGTVIYVYDECEESALETLKHEFMEYHINKEIIQPLVKFINIQKCVIEDLIYSRKERLIERFLKFLKLL